MQSKPLKILLGLTGLSLDGGISSVSRCIVRVLDREVSEGRVAAAGKVSLYDSPDDNGGFSDREALGMRRKLRFALRLWREILVSRPDLVLFDHVGLGRALMLDIAVPRPSFDVFVHGLELVGVEGDKRAEVLRSARRILANSIVTANALAEKLPELEGKIFTVPLCIEPDRLDAWRQGDSAGVDSAREPAVLIVGRMWSNQPGKGHDAVIRCLPMVSERISEVQLWIAGGGDDVERLRGLARDTGCEERVHFLGRVSDRRLRELYSRASVFAMPSAQEGFGLVYLEAMWHGLPCIGSTEDAARCVISDSCGRLVRYGDPISTGEAIIDLMADPIRRQDMGKEARRHVEQNFSADTFSRNLLDALGIKGKEDEGT